MSKLRLKGAWVGDINSNLRVCIVGGEPRGYIMAERMISAVAFSLKATKIDCGEFSIVQEEEAKAAVESAILKDFERFVEVVDAN